MGGQTISGSAQPVVVTIQGSISAVSAGVALTPLCGKNNHASTPTTIGTVPANKIWKIWGAYLQKSNVYQTGATDSYLKINGVTTIQLNDSAPAASVIASSQVTLNLNGGYIQIAAAQTVTILSGNGATYVSGGIVYTEETV